MVKTEYNSRDPICLYEHEIDGGKLILEGPDWSSYPTSPCSTTAYLERPDLGRDGVKVYELLDLFGSAKEAWEALRTAIKKFRDDPEAYRDWRRKWNGFTRTCVPPVTKRQMKTRKWQDQAAEAEEGLASWLRALERSR